MNKRHLTRLLGAGAIALLVVAAPAATSAGALPVPSLPAPIGPIVNAVDDVIDAVIDIVTGDPAAIPDEAEDLVSYQVHTVYAGAAGTIDKTSDAVLLVPTPVNVDDDLTTGTGGNDISVQLTVDAGRATLRVQTLPNAPSPLPLAVEAIVADPRRSSELKVAFGYDALVDTAPAVYDATIALVGASRLSSFALDVTTVSPGDTLGVTAGVFDEGADGERVNPQHGRIDFTPVPAVTHLNVLTGSDLGLTQSGVDFVVDTPTTVDLLLEDVRGDNVTRAVGRIEAVPQTLSLLLTSDSDGTQNWTYRSNARVGLIDLRVVGLDGGTVDEDFRVRLEDLPLNMALLSDSPTHSTFTADSPVGLIAAGFASGGAVADLADAAYLYQTAEPGFDSLAFRVLGLSRAELSTADPMVIDVDMAPGPFHVLIEDGARTIDGMIRDLPSSIRAELSTTASKLSLAGNARIGEIVVDAHDPAGLAGRATDLDLRLADLPEEVTFSYGGEGATTGVDAHGGTIGSVDLLLTSGPVITVQDGFDGVVLEDVASHFALVAKLKGLKLATVSTGTAPYELALDKAAGPFVARLEQGERTTHIEFKDLPDSLRATFNPAGSLNLTGSAPIAEITAAVDDPAGVAGRATQADALLRDVPTTIDLTWDTDGDAVGLDAHGQRVGLLEVVLTSGPAITVPDGFDGVVLEDLADRYGVALRMNGLELAQLSTGAAPYSIQLDKDAGPFVVDLQQGARSTHIEAHDLPDSLDATLDPAGSLTLTSSAAIAELSATLTDPAGVGGRATSASALLRSVPTTLDVAWNADGGQVGVDAKGQTVGLIDVLLTSGPELSVPDGFDGVVLDDVADHYGVAIRLAGLKKALVSTGTAPYTIELDKAAGPFLVDLEQGARQTRVEILDLPDSLDATLDPAGSLTLAGSAPIGEINTTISDPAGVSGRATSARALLRDVPTTLDVVWSATGGKVGVDAKGQTVGLIDVLLTSGPEISVPAGFDGALLEDVVTHYAVAIRLNQLKKAMVSTGAAPYSLDLQKGAGPFSVRLLQGTRDTNIQVLDLPSVLNATVNPAGSLAYTSSAGIAKLTASVVDTAAAVSGRAKRVEATLTGLPNALDVTWAGGGGALSADAKGKVVGAIDFLMTSGPIETIAAGEDGVKVRDLVDRYVVVGRLTGLKKVTFAQGPPPSFTLDTLGGRKFTAEIDTQKQAGISTIDATINVLPATVSVNVGTGANLAYTASGAVGSITLDAFDPDGISGRAKTLHAILNNVPTRLDVATATNGTITADAFGGTVGYLELQLTSGPDDRISSSFDGLLLNDLTDRYVMFARLTGLKKAVGGTTPAPSLNLQTTASRPFKLELNKWNGSKVEYNRATLLNLPASVNLVVNGQNISYSASSATTSLSFDTNVGNRWNTHADISNPLPASFTVCVASDVSCTPIGDRANHPSADASFRFVASQHTTVNLFDCVAPANATCPASPSEFTRISNLRVRVLGQDGRTTQLGDAGHIYIDTDNFALSGQIHTQQGNSGFRETFNTNFFSQNRLGRWTGYGLPFVGSNPQSGTVNCAGSSLEVRFFLWIDVTGFLC